MCGCAWPCLAVVTFALFGSQAAVERAEAINGIEKLANGFVQSGRCDDWFAGADPFIARALLRWLVWVLACFAVGIVWREWAVVGSTGESH